MPENGHQVPGVHHQAVGVLEKDLAAAVPRPVPGRGPGPGVAGPARPIADAGAARFRPELLRRLVHRLPMSRLNVLPPAGAENSGRLV